MRKKEMKAEMPQAFTDEALKEVEEGQGQERMEKNEKPLLRNRSYLLLLQGNLFSGFGDVLFSIAAGIWVYKQTGSTMMMSVMSSISMAKQEKDDGVDGLYPRSDAGAGRTLVLGTSVIGTGADSVCGGDGAVQRAV